MEISVEQIQAEIKAERERLLAKYRQEIEEQDRALIGAGAVHQYCGTCDKTFTGPREEHERTRAHRHGKQRPW